MTHIVTTSGHEARLYLRYYLPDNGAIAIVDKHQEAVRFTAERAEYLARVLGKSWKAEEL